MKMLSIIITHNKAGASGCYACTLRRQTEECPSQLYTFPQTKENDRKSYAPASPLSFVQCTCFEISSSVTVGRTWLIARTKSPSRSGGSSNSSLSRSPQFLSTASRSPGLHGVHLGHLPDTVFWYSVCGACTCLKWVAERTLRTGCIRASRTTTATSEPE